MAAGGSGAVLRLAWAGWVLAREGVLDGLSSDYVPGSLLQAAWCLHRDAGFSLPAAMQVVSDDDFRLGAH